MDGLICSVSGTSYPTYLSIGLGCHGHLGGHFYHCGWNLMVGDQVMGKEFWYWTGYTQEGHGWRQESTTGLGLIRYLVQNLKAPHCMHGFWGNTITDYLLFRLGPEGSIGSTSGYALGVLQIPVSSVVLHRALSQKHYWSPSHDIPPVSSWIKLNSPGIPIPAFPSMVGSKYYSAHIYGSKRPALRFKEQWL